MQTRETTCCRSPARSLNCSPGCPDRVESGRAEIQGPTSRGARLLKGRGKGPAKALRGQPTWTIVKLDGHCNRRMMSKIVAILRRRTVTGYWRALVAVIPAGHWLACVIVSSVAMVVYRIVQQVPEHTQLLLMDKESWLAMSRSICASAIFFLVTEAIVKIRNVPKNVQEQFSERMQSKLGLTDGFVQRGSTDALAAYEDVLRHAEKRVWAIGCTNARFCQREETISRLMTAKDSRVDVRIVFLNPDALVRWNGHERALVSLQTSQENGTGHHGMGIGDRIARLRVLAAGLTGATGRLRVYKLTTACLFTCLLVDDCVFFFPMLARSDSGQDPTLLATTREPVGKALLEHFTKVLAVPEFSEVVFQYPSAS